MKYGYTLYCEGNDPRSLIKQASQAEEAGFDFLVISDHFHPWLPEQTHAGFAWSILGAVAQATTKIELATMVTCPIIRYHPAIVAQAAATIGVISGGRFTLGLGAGENLNEHVVGRDWPPVQVRHDMLTEAIEIIRGLWRGGYYSYSGKFFRVYDARVFDLPERPVKFFMAASGKASSKLAASAGGGLCLTEPQFEVTNHFKKSGGDAEDVWGQVITAWNAKSEAGLKEAHDNFRFAAGGWKVQAELPNPVNFAAATQTVRQEDLASSMPAGPDADRHLEFIKKFQDAGIKNLALAYPGKNFDGYFKFWREQLKPKLT
jgi:G6PDH family F420-dependent oxidoreductase